MSESVTSFWLHPTEPPESNFVFFFTDYITADRIVERVPQVFRNLLTSFSSKTVQSDISVEVKVKVKFSLEQATKSQRGSRCIALLFLQLRH